MVKKALLFFLLFFIASVIATEYFSYFRKRRAYELVYVPMQLKACFGKRIGHVPLESDLDNYLSENCWNLKEWIELGVFHFRYVQENDSIRIYEIGFDGEFQRGDSLARKSDINFCNYLIGRPKGDVFMGSFGVKPE